MRNFISIILLLVLSNCDLDCAEKKTGMHKSSPTLYQSKENGVYNFEMHPDKSLFTLDSGRVFQINNAWVENSWMYECIDNDPVIKKEAFVQLVLDCKLNKELAFAEYTLMETKHSSGTTLNSILNFNYSGEDTLILHLMKNKTVIDTIKFIKR